MKEKIEEKLNENIERILAKEELLPTDVAILKERLNEIKTEESEKNTEEKKKEMVNLFGQMI